MRIASFDIETTDLRANMGTLLCASFHEIVPPGYYRNHHDAPNKPYTFVVEDTHVGDPNPDRSLAIGIIEATNSHTSFCVSYSHSFVA